MNDKNTSTLPKLIKPIIKFIIGLVVLLIIRAVVSSLPMIKDATIARFPLTPLQIAVVVVDTIIIVILLNFGREIGNSLRFAVEHFPKVGTIANLVVVLVAVSIAYGAYNRIGFLLPRNIHWIYPVIFIVLAVIPLYFLVMTIYRNIDKLTDLTVRRIETATKKHSICSNCGARLSANASFCSNCGQQIVKEEKVVEEPVKCPECGATVDKDAKFCEECGSRIAS